MENLSNYCLELEEQWKNCIKKDGNKEDIKGCRFLPLTGKKRVHKFRLCKVCLLSALDY